MAAAITRLVKKGRLANPRHGFLLILRPEDQLAGAPDPVRWIDPLMKHQGHDYRISLLRAAAFHGSSHQAAMVFQVVVPQASTICALHSATMPIARGIPIDLILVRATQPISCEGSLREPRLRFTV
jgi:AbiEi antitoxin C-terminal domain